MSNNVVIANEEKIAATMFNNVLIIDDNEIDLFICEKIMNQSGFANNIVTSQNVSDALYFLNHKSLNPSDFPNYIFLDLFMPIQSGYDFLDAFSKINNAVKNKCKVVILSVLINPEEMETIKKNQNVYAIFQKPITPESLINLIELHNVEMKTDPVKILASDSGS